MFQVKHDAKVSGFTERPGLTLSLVTESPWQRAEDCMFRRWCAWACSVARGLHAVSLRLSALSVAPQQILSESGFSHLRWQAQFRSFEELTLVWQAAEGMASAWTELQEPTGSSLRGLALGSGLIQQSGGIRCFCLGLIS